MSRWERRIPATAHPDAPVLPWPVGQPAPALPAGAAGIAVHVRSRSTDPMSWDAHKAVGVDDRPMWQGLGRMVVLTTPGAHLVEVRGRFSTETARRVRVAAGQIVELDYWTPASYFPVDGVLVPAPARRRPGHGVLPLVVPAVAFALLLVLVLAAGVRADGPVPVLFLLGAVLVTVVATRVKRRRDLDYRAAVSVEAADGDADHGLFLADGEPPAGLADDRHGLLVVRATAWLRYDWNGRGALVPATKDPNAWLPWPVLAVDGEARPFSWRGWAYRLPPGEHLVTVSLRSPAPDRPTVTTVPVRVRLTAGQVTRLDLPVRATLAVHSRRPGERFPTDVVSYTPTVTPKPR